MSTDIVPTEYRQQLDDLRVVTIEGEFWSARDLMRFAGYTDWRNWSKAIDRAVAAVDASGLDASDHFVGVNKMVDLGSGAKRPVEDVQLTRYGCYILFQNSDGSKPEIAAMQSYFAVQTRKQELGVAEFDPTSIEGAALLIRAAQTALEKVKELEPRAEAWDAIASAEGDYSVGDAAKILARAGVETGPQRLFAAMERLKWVYRGSDGAWRAYAHRVDRGHLSERPQFHYHPATGERVVDAPQVRVTVKGVEQLRRRLGSTLKAVSA